MWRLLTLTWLYLNMLHLISSCLEVRARLHLWSNSYSSRQTKQEDAKRLSGKHLAKNLFFCFFFLSSLKNSLSDVTFWKGQKALQSFPAHCLVLGGFYYTLNQRMSFQCQIKTDSVQPKTSDYHIYTTGALTSLQCLKLQLKQNYNRATLLATRLTERGN